MQGTDSLRFRGRSRKENGADEPGLCARKIAYCFKVIRIERWKESLKYHLGFCGKEHQDSVFHGPCISRSRVPGLVEEQLTPVI